MDNPRRKCKLADSNHKNVDIRRFEKLIIDTVNKTVPNKNPKVFEEYFSTDLLTQREAVLLGRALAKIDELKSYGKTVTTFRLFDGKVYSSEDKDKPIKKGGNNNGKKVHKH